MGVIELAVALAAISLGGGLFLLLGIRPTRCSDCGVLGLVSPSSAPRRCQVCADGLLAYPPSFLSGLFVRPAVLRAEERRRRRR